MRGCSHKGTQEAVDALADIETLRAAEYRIAAAGMARHSLGEVLDECYFPAILTAPDAS